MVVARAAHEVAPAPLAPPRTRARNIPSVVLAQPSSGMVRSGRTRIGGSFHAGAPCNHECDVDLARRSMSAHRGHIVCFLRDGVARTIDGTFRARVLGEASGAGAIS